MDSPERLKERALMKARGLWGAACPGCENVGATREGQHNLSCPDLPGPVDVAVLVVDEVQAALGEILPNPWELDSLKKAQRLWVQEGGGTTAPSPHQVAALLEEEVGKALEVAARGAPMEPLVPGPLPPPMLVIPGRGTPPCETIVNFTREGSKTSIPMAKIMAITFVAGADAEEESLRLDLGGSDEAAAIWYVPPDQARGVAAAWTHYRAHVDGSQVGPGHAPCFTPAGIERGALEKVLSGEAEFDPRKLTVSLEKYLKVEARAAHGDAVRQFMTNVLVGSRVAEDPVEFLKGLTQEAGVLGDDAPDVLVESYTRKREAKTGEELRRWWVGTNWNAHHEDFIGGVELVDLQDGQALEFLPGDYAPGTVVRVYQPKAHSLGHKKQPGCCEGNPA